MHHRPSTRPTFNITRDLGQPKKKTGMREPDYFPCVRWPHCLGKDLICRNFVGRIYDDVCLYGRIACAFGNGFRCTRGMTSKKILIGQKDFLVFAVSNLSKILRDLSISFRIIRDFAVVARSSNILQFLRRIDFLSFLLCLRPSKTFKDLSNSIPDKSGKLMQNFSALFFTDILQILHEKSLGQPLTCL